MSLAIQLVVLVVIGVFGTSLAAPAGPAGPGSAAAGAPAAPTYTEDKPLECPKLKSECAMEKDKQVKYFKTFTNVLRSHPEVANYEEVCAESSKSTTLTLTIFDHFFRLYVFTTEITEREASQICDATDDILYQAKVYLRCIASHGGPSPYVFLIAVENFMKCKWP